MNIFLDIGAHWGETLEEVIKPHWLFDKVYAFEPDPDAIAILQQRFSGELASGKLTILEFGLSDRDDETNLYGDNSGGGASLFAQKQNIDCSKSKRVRLRKTSDFVEESIAPGDLCIAKLNCEGGEIDILNDLLESALLARWSAFMVDFDIAKIAGKQSLARSMRRRLDNEAHGQFQLCGDVMIGPTHQDRIANWLFGLDLAPTISALPPHQRPMVRRPGFKRQVQRRIAGY